MTKKITLTMIALVLTSSVFAISQKEERIISELISNRAKEIAPTKKEEEQVVKIVKKAVKNKKTLEKPLVGTTTPLMVASILNDNTELVNYILQKGAKVNYTRPDGVTALMWAVFFNNPNTSLLLLKNGANPNIAITKPPIKGLTPLLLAIQYHKDLAFQKAMLELAITDDRGFNKTETLIFAVQYNSGKAIVEKIVKAGAPLHVIYENHGNIIDIAERVGNKEVISYLKTARKCEEKCFKVIQERKKLPLENATGRVVSMKQYDTWNSGEGPIIFFNEKDVTEDFKDTRYGGLRKAIQDWEKNKCQEIVPCEDNFYKPY